MIDINETSWPRLCDILDVISLRNMQSAMVIIEYYGVLRIANYITVTPTPKNIIRGGLRTPDKLLTLTSFCG